MKCTNCGFESQEEMNFCTECGAPVAAPVVFGFNPLAGKILEALKDNLFLVLCILMTVSSALSVISGGLPVINILATVFLWLTYSQALKGIADPNHLRSLSGSVYAGYVVTNVSAIILIVCGIIISFSFGLLANSLELIDAIEAEIGAVYPEFGGLPQAILEIAGWLIGAVFTVGAAICLVINILGMKKIHRFVKSVYQSLMLPMGELVNPCGAKNWLIFFGVCEGITALSSLAVNFLSAISSGCCAAAIIISVVLINKYFLSAEKK